MTISVIEERLELMGAGIKIISKEYKNAHTPVKFQCDKCGFIFLKTWSNIQSLKQYCPKCGVKRRWENRKRITEKDVNEIIKSNYPNIELLTNNVQGAKQKLKFYCHGCESTFYQHYNALQNKKGCKTCGVKRRSGENHHSYNPNLTEEERSLSRDMLYGKSKRSWRAKVHKAHGWRCVLCGSKEKLIAHHLDSYANHPDKRLDVDNGVTLCDYHHKDFHAVYGYKNNTKNQFESYKRVF